MHRACAPYARSRRKTIASESREVRRRGTLVDLVVAAPRDKSLKTKVHPRLTVNGHPLNFRNVRSVSYDEVIR